MVKIQALVNKEPVVRGPKYLGNDFTFDKARICILNFSMIGKL